MKIRLLGTGTPTPSTRRKSSGYAIEIGGDTILFDHGPGAYHRMLEAGIEPQRTTHLFFSHLHYDHCADYATLVLTRWDQGGGRIPELKVYGPPPIRRMTSLLFAEDGVYGPDLEARTKHPGSVARYQSRGGTLPRRRPDPAVRELTPGDSIGENGWEVTVGAVVHVQPYLTCYGYRLESDAGSVAYSGDTGPCKSMIRLAQGCDVLIHMCHYISGGATPFFTERTETTKAITGHLDLAQIAHEAQVKNLVITHVSAPMDVDGVRERLIAEIARIYKGNVFFGQDLMEIPIGGPTAGTKPRNETS
jgi:ribonuclease BN (tRNA processing enzyme)